MPHRRAASKSPSAEGRRRFRPLRVSSGRDVTPALPPTGQPLAALLRSGRGSGDDPARILLAPSQKEGYLGRLRIDVLLANWGTLGANDIVCDGGEDAEGEQAPESVDERRGGVGGVLVEVDDRLREPPHGSVRLLDERRWLAVQPR